MIVPSFAIKTKGGAGYKLALLDQLKNILEGDNIWHFFLDPEGITLRVHEDYKDVAIAGLKQAKKDGYNFTYKFVGYFNPTLHEYQFVRFAGDELQYIFHATSLMALKYPRHVIQYPVLERINHIVINQTGQHDFKKEAEDYIDAAYLRASMQGRFLGLPKWIHKFIIKLFFYEKPV